MLTGTLFALAASLMWGLVFVVPLLLPDYPPALLSAARYLTFGVIALPLAARGFAGVWAWFGMSGHGFDMPIGPQPQRFIASMLALGRLASWIGTLCWNVASQRLPTALAGQLIVFETLAALACALLLRGQAPPLATAAGIALLVAGVVWALRVKPEPLPEAGAGARH